MSDTPTTAAGGEPVNEPLYDAGVVERAAAELDSGGQGGDRLGDTVRNLVKLLDKTAVELTQANAKLAAILAHVGPVAITRGRMTPDSPVHAGPALALARVAPFEHEVRGWKGRAAELETQVDAVRALHKRVSDDSGHYCDSCLNGWGESIRGPCATIRIIDAVSDATTPVPAAAPPAGSTLPEALGVVWRGWVLGLQDWAEESLRVDPTPTDRWDLGWNAALKALCISIVHATLGDFPYQVDPDCECEGRCPMCARWGCEQCCDGEMPSDHGVKEGIVVRVPEGP